MRLSQLTVNGISVRLGSYTAELEYIGYEEPRRPWNITAHWHKSFEIHFVGAGNGRLVTDSGEYELSDGIIFITGPDIVHSQTSGVEGAMDEFCLTVGFSKAETPMPDADDSTDAMIEYLQRNPFFLDRAELGCRELCLSIMKELCGRLPGYKDRARATLTELLLRVLRHVFGIVETEVELPVKGTIGGVNYRALLERYLLKYQYPTDEETLAGILHISRRHLGRLMRRYYGMTYAEKINSLRVEMAKRLLVTTDLPVSEIARKVGFTTPQYFIRVFRKYGGGTPGDYRRAERSGMK